MLDAQLALACELLTESGRWPVGLPIVPTRMTRVKVRSFTPPGATLHLRAALRPDSASDAALSVDLTASADGKPVATARAEFSTGSFT